MAVDCPEDQIDDLELNNRFVKPFQLNIYQRHKLYFFFFYKNIENSFRYYLLKLIGTVPNLNYRMPDVNYTCTITHLLAK